MFHMIVFINRITSTAGNMLPIFRPKGSIPSNAQYIANIIDALHRLLPIYLCLTTTTPFEILVGQTSNFRT